MNDNYIKIKGKTIRLNEDDVKELEKKYSKPEVDFSEFVGLWGVSIAILGKKMLKSRSNKTIHYDDNCRNEYTNHTPAYEEIKAGDLEPGDVFFVGSLEEAEKEQRLTQFGVCMGKNYYQVCYNYLYEDLEVEHMECAWIVEGITVVRFKRGALR